MNVFFLVIILISLIFVAATIFLGRKFARKKVLKYIPAILAGAGLLVFLLNMQIANNDANGGWEALGYAIYAMIAGVIFVSSMAAALLLEIINRRRS